MTPIFPDCYDEWGLYKITYDGDHKMYEMLYEGTGRPVPSICLRQLHRQGAN
jgi:hypothetical protein